MLYEETEKTTYKNALDSFINKILSGEFTPKGLRFIDAWGSLRHAANVAQLFFQVGLNNCFFPKVKLSNIIFTYKIN